MISFPFNRRVFYGLTLILLMLGATAFTASVGIKIGFGQSITSLQIVPSLVSKSYGDIGTTFDVNVTIDDVTDFFGFELNVTWDSSLLALAQVDYTTTLNKIWGSGHWFAVKNESGVGYHLLVALSTANSFSTTVPTPLYRLTFTVLDPQSNPDRECSIHFAMHNLSDSNGSPISHTATDGTYRFEAFVRIEPTLTEKCSSDVGTAFNVSVTVQGVTNLYGFDFNIVWNSTLLTFNNCYYSDTFDALWGSGQWVVTGSQNGPGFCRLAASSTVDTFNTTGSQTMYKIEFLVNEPMEPSESSIHFASHALSDRLANPIGHFVGDGTYRFANTLTVVIVGEGSVNVNPNQTAYAYGTIVTLTAYAYLGWTFLGWSGDASGTYNTTTVYTTGNMAVTATFVQIDYTLTVSYFGAGSVTLNQTYPYHYGDVVELTAVPAVGWSFDHWGGNLFGSANPAMLLVTGNTTVDAYFVEGGYTLTVSVVGSGYVTVDNNGINVTLTAYANAGWTFAGWGGDASGTDNPITLVLDRDLAVTATFALNILIVNIIGSGSVGRNPDQAAYAYGTNVTLTAYPRLGWTFAGWSGNASGTANPIVINMTSDMVVNATFTQNHYTLTVTTVGSGSVTVNRIGPYHYGDEIQLTAIPSVGWSFQYWSGGLSGSANPVILTITGNVAVTATFMPGAYTLTVNIIGGGQVSAIPSQVTYAYGTNVTLNAYASYGWTFASWSGDASGTANPIVINMTSDMVVNATFTQINYTLTVSTVGSGSVTLNNTGPYHYGDVVRFTPVPDGGWSFQYWSGGLGGSVSPANLLITGNVAVTATFIEGGYALAVTISGGGSVTKSLDYAAYAYGTNVTLTAYAEVGWTFSGWTGNLSGAANPATINMTGNANVTAVFYHTPYTLTVSTVGSGSVTVNKSAPYYYGDVIRLTAVPTVGWNFQYWTGGLSGSTSPATLLITGDVAVTATFIQSGGYSLTVSTVGSGSVTLNNTGPYHYGDAVQLTAVPAVGWSFQYWSGGLSGSTNPAVLSMTGSVTVTATFTQNTYTLTANVVGGGSVSKNPNQTSYPHGTNVTLTASANVGWTFLGWSGDASGAANPIVVNMTSNKSITATFSQAVYTLTMFTVGQGSVLPGNGTYPPGANVGLQAITAAGWMFAGWSGGASGSSNTTIVMNNNVTVTATFTPAAYTLTVNVVGGGSVTASPNQTSYVYGTNVTLNASANFGWTFLGWSGDASGTASPIIINMTRSKSVTATFAQTVYTLTVSVVGNGSVDLNKMGPYPYGDVVQLTATPDENWSFESWSGDLTGSSNPATITMTGNFSVTANFTQQPMLHMDPESMTCYTYGENFTVAIDLANALNVSGFTFEIQFNTTLLAYISATWDAWGTGTINVDEAAGNITGATSGVALNLSQSLITFMFQAASEPLEHAATGTIFIQRANLSYTDRPTVGYEKGGLNEIIVGPDFAYMFSPLRGDINHDSSIDILDAILLSASYNSSPGSPRWNPNADINGDNVVDIFDAILLAANFGKTA